MARRPIIAPPAGVYMPGAETPLKPDAAVAGISLIGQRRASQLLMPTALPAADAQVHTSSETPAQNALPRRIAPEQPPRAARPVAKAAKSKLETSIRYEWRVFVSPSVKLALDIASDSSEETRLIIVRACKTAWRLWMKAMTEAENLRSIPDAKPELLHILRRRLSVQYFETLLPHYGVKGVGLVNPRMAEALWPYVDAAILEILAARS